MKLIFNAPMLIGLCMIPGGLVLGFLLMWVLVALGRELEAVAGFVPGVITSLAGIAVFLVGLGMELH